jgi:succinate dehydrogenase / fumarate reductase flavoprotein subunit/fumarate reductase flavoprotein subunit
MYNALGERFMSRYDPQRMERSTRDIVARAGYIEIQAGRGTPSGAILLDVSHLGAEFVERNFPGMVQRCREAGFDLAREPVEVSPTAHFHMGGARIDPWCRTNLEGLFVAGEDAGGVHGANRLGGNGVAESTVFGARAGDFVADYVKERGQPALREAQIEEATAEAIKPFSSEGGEDLFLLRRELEELMWEKVGVVRSGKELGEALEHLGVLWERAQHAPVKGDPRYNPQWQEYLNLRSLLTVARLTALSALSRTESRGSHYRTDFPERDDANWLRNICIQRDEAGEPRLWTEPVVLSRLTPDQVKA